MLTMWLAMGLLAHAGDPPDSLHITGRGAARMEALNCETDPCGEVLPEAVRFETVEGKPYMAGFDGQDTPVGWVVLSTNVVDIKGYSSKPLHTVVGLSVDGVITGGKVVYHSEPILLVGIPSSELDGFVSAHEGFAADARVMVGASNDGHPVDVVSGATVTVLAASQTVMETARALATDVGVIARAPRVPGHFVEAEPWSWKQLVRKGALGHLRVDHADMDLAEEAEGRPFVDLWFGIADAPQVGIPLLGDATWAWAVSKLEPGEHLFVVFNGGAYSYKGSGFVRGGLFDRFRVEQGLAAVSFRDMDYTRVESPPAEGAPDLPEGGLFIARDDLLDPGRTYEFVFLGSSYATERGAFERDFKAFSANHRVPRSVYVLDGPDPESMIWRQAWATSGPWVAAVSLYLAMIIGVFVFRGWATAQMERLHRLHLVAAMASFFGLGLWLHVQPSVTQLLTIAGSIQGEWSWGLFLSDPFLFVSWIFIAGVTLAWGRGVFCGWVCPYGAMNELTFKLGRMMGLPSLELPDNIHFKARSVRYGVFFGLLAAYLVDAELGERLAEVEPFKSTFFVPLWTRHPGLIAWWAVLLLASFTTYRPFCRYLCPLGAALAIPSTVRLSGPYRRDFCTKCKICARGCEPRAIRPDGTIDPRECLNCWECEANWSDDTVCPPLVKIRRDRERAAK